MEKAVKILSTALVVLAAAACLPAYAYKASLANGFQQATKDGYQRELAADSKPQKEQIASHQEHIDSLGRCAVQREVLAGLKNRPCSTCPPDLPSADILAGQSLTTASHYVYFVMALEDQFGIENVNADALRWQLEDSWAELRKNLEHLYSEDDVGAGELNRICTVLLKELEERDNAARQLLNERSEPADGGHFYQ